MTRFLGSLLWLALVMCVATPAFAQPAPAPGTTGATRPYRGVYSGGTDGWSQSLTMNMGLGGGFEHVTFDPTRIEGTASEPARQASGVIATAGLTYGVSLSRFGADASVSAAARYYPSLTDSVFGGRSVDFGAWMNLSSRTLVETNFDVSYRPAYDLDILGRRALPELGDQPVDPEDVSPVVVDDTRRFLTTLFEVSFSHSLTSRTTVFGKYGIDHTFYASDVAPDLSTWSASGGVSQRLTKGLSLRLAYGQWVGGYGRTGFDGQARTVSRSLDAGLSFDHALSLTRKTTIWFTSGSTAITDGSDTRYQLTGRVVLERTFGRTWTAGVGFLRDAAFVGSVRDLVFYEGIDGVVSGLVGRRLSLSVSAGASRGTVGVSTDSNGLSNYHTSTGLTYGFTRYLGLATFYSYYHHNVGEGVALLPGALHVANRHSVTFNLTLWQPLLHRARSANASR